jgi:uncharacterized glyoxalase superfamily protein PhnB
MLKNRSVPADILIPHLVYRDVAEAIVWLTRVFSFTEHFRYGDPPAGAQLRFGDAWIMISSTRPGRSTPAQTGSWTQSLTLFVEDVDPHFAKTKSEGAKIFEDLHETIYGERQYGVEDLDGHPWLFSTHVRDLSPAEWGAVLASPQT